MADFVELVPVPPDRRIILSPRDARWLGGLAAKHPAVVRDAAAFLHYPAADWQALDEGLEWEIDLARAGEYVLAYNGGANATLTRVEFAVGGQRLVHSPQRKRTRVPEVGRLHLPAGRQTLSVRSIGPLMGRVWIFGVELVPADVFEAEQREAAATRADASWLLREQYGVFLHWTSQTRPGPGAPDRPYVERVERFDTERFADTMAEMGAAYVVFTTNHAGYYLPFPSAAASARLPAGHVAGRDLVADLAASLGRRGIRLIVYYHPYGDDPAIRRAIGFDDWLGRDKTAFWDYWVELIEDLGHRYGDGVAGWWFDGGQVYYAYDAPFRRLTTAARAGSPRRIVCYNPWDLPRLTDLQDYYSGEYWWERMDATEPGEPQAGLTPFILWNLEQADWPYTEAVKTPVPLGGDSRPMIDFVRCANASGRGAIINLMVYQDGTFHPDLVWIMAGVRRAVRGS